MWTGERMSITAQDQCPRILFAPRKLVRVESWHGLHGGVATWYDIVQ
jgi:hypothetical protein